MNPRLVLKLAAVLSLSSLRAKKGSAADKWSSLKLIMASALAGFLASAAIAYYLYFMISAEFNLSQPLFQFLSFLPLLSITAVLFYGIMFELGRDPSLSSIHAVNWLPITPAEYVISSTLSTIFFTLPLLSILWGGLLGLSAAMGLIQLWAFSAALSVLGMMIGGSITEVLKALMSKFSSSMYRRRGRTVIVLRVASTTALIILFVLAMNMNVLLRVLSWFTGAVETVWALPPFWLSLAVIKFVQVDLVSSATFSALSIGFFAAMLKLGISMRERYWAPSEPSIRLSSGEYIPKIGFLRRLGLSPAESAIAKKDLRTFFRRRETASLIAIPIMLIIIPLISGPDPEKIFMIGQPIVGILLFAMILSSTSIGREGSGILNLLVTPIKASEIMRGKLASTLILSAPPLALLLAVMSLALGLRPEAVIALTIGSYIALLESSIIGLIFGARYPDFTTIPRARFITQKGMLLCMAATSAAITATLTPLIIYKLFHPQFLDLYTATAMTVAVGTVVSIAAYKAASRSISQLYFMRGGSYMTLSEVSSFSAPFFHAHS